MLKNFEKREFLAKMAIYKKWNKTENRYIYYIDYYDEKGMRQRESTGSRFLYLRKGIC